MKTRYWLHVSPAERVAHLLAIAGDDASDARDVQGFAYRDIADPISLTSRVLDISHGDADAVLMGQEMLGNDDAWLEIDPATYADAAAMGDIDGAPRASLQHLQCTPGQLLAGTSTIVPARVF